MGAFRHPNALLPGSETRVDFFATNACNLPKYALEHVWECFWAFGSGTKNDAKRVHFGTRMHYCRVGTDERLLGKRTHAIFVKMHYNMVGSDLGHSDPARKPMQYGSSEALDSAIGG